MKNLTLATLAALLVVSASQTHAATFFTENFSGGLGANLSTLYGATNVDATGGDVDFTGTTNGTRGSIGTNDSDYAGSNFRATIDVTAAGGETIFFGLGAGTSTGAGGAPHFGEPGDGPTTYARISGGTLQGLLFFPVSGLAAPTVTISQTGVTNLRMVNDPLTDMLEYFYSTDNGANFVSIGTIDYSGSTLGAGVSRIFVAGGNGVSSIDNLDVRLFVPEPTSLLLLLGLGGVMTFKRRRR